MFTGGEDWSAILIGGRWDCSGTVCGVVEPGVADWATVKDEELGERNGLAVALRTIDLIINVESRSVTTHRKSFARQYLLAALGDDAKAMHQMLVSTICCKQIK